MKTQVMSSLVVINLTRYLDGQNIVTNPTSSQPGFDLLRQIWTTLNHDHPYRNQIIDP